MQQKINEYRDKFIELINSISVKDHYGNPIDFSSGIKSICGFITGIKKQDKKIMFIGNGGSASIASHMATDFLKNGNIRALAFNDGSLLTCLGNDLGFENIFKKPIEMMAEENDILLAISSSGKSTDILKAVEAAKQKPCIIITLSGFNENNPLRTMGDINYFVPSSEYGLVEVIHQYICHIILDIYMGG